MSIDHGDSKDGREPRRGRRRGCRFCNESDDVIDYKDAQTMRYFVTDRGKIVARRNSGACAKHQRAITTSVKRARAIALLPYTN